jgi:rhodanese-related sulfurtransferase
VWPLTLIASDPQLLEKASTLASAKFLGRIRSIYTSTSGHRWVAYIEDAGNTALDEAMLWDVVRKTPHVLNPHTPPLGSRGISDILVIARSRLERISPKQAYDELHDLTFPLPVVLVDIRPIAQRREHGEIPNTLIIERNVLEWRFDPRSEARIAIADRYDLRIIVFCHEGYTSSLAAASLHDIGLLNATDMVGGFMAWKEAGLPTTTQPNSSCAT